MKKSLIIALGFLFLVRSSAEAYDGFSLYPDQCTNYFSLYESKFKIPKHLLRAISIQESGRKLGGSDEILPWPWTINVHGEGYYFTSETEAIQKVRDLQAKGISSIDVGCMQVNLKHHPKAFRDISQAFEPQYNVAYAAKLLKSHYDRLGTWENAVASYHNAEERIGWVYLRKVLRVWDTLRHRPSFRERTYLTPMTRFYSPISYQAPNIQYYNRSSSIPQPTRKPI